MPPFTRANFIIALLCIFGLWIGARLIINAAVRIGRAFGLSESVIGLTIVALGSSAPEYAVALNSSLTQQHDLALGNIVGSNIFNIGFILGGIALFTVIPTTKRLVHRDGSLLVTCTALLTLFFLDLNLARWEGFIFLLILITYFTYLLYRREGNFSERAEAGRFHWYDIPLFFVGSLLLVFSSNLFVTTATEIAGQLNLSDWTIGLTLVAFGTALPELATTIAAVSQKRLTLSASHLVGSNLFNLLGVLGLSALLSRNASIMVPYGARYTTAILLVLTLFLVGMMWTGWRLTRREAILLILLSGIAWAINLFGIPFL